MARLLVDIGGTNCRFALAADDGSFDSLHAVATTDFPTLMHAIEHYRTRLPGHIEITGAAIGAAGPVAEGRVQLTNAEWLITTEDTSQSIDGAPVRLLNDLEVVALALPALDPATVTPLGPVEQGDPDRSCMIAINVGTGFGAASVVPVGENEWCACPSESGHMVFGALNAQELRLLESLSEPPWTVENLLSGPGIRRLYVAAGGELPEDGADGQVPQVFGDIQDEAARKLAGLVSDWLGRVTGDLVLTHGAWGGAYLVGGVVEGWASLADPARFRRAFQAKDKMSDRMANVFTGIVKEPRIALKGLATVTF